MKIKKSTMLIVGKMVLGGLSGFAIGQAVKSSAEDKNLFYKILLSLGSITAAFGIGAAYDLAFSNQLGKCGS